jgi:hypothetical protein
MSTANPASTASLPPARGVASTPTGTRHPHRWIIAAVVIALAVVGLITYGFHEADQEADAKADQLIAAFQQAGLPVPANRDTITRTLGNDGGAVCDDPGGALRTGLLNAQLVNGASFVGQRPIRGAVNVVRGESLILQVYCPDQLPAFRDSVSGYRLDDTVKE